MKPKISLSLALCLAVVNILSSQPRDSLVEKQKVKVVPGARYEAGWIHRLFFGTH